MNWPLAAEGAFLLLGVPALTAAFVTWRTRAINRRHYARLAEIQEKAR